MHDNHIVTVGADDIAAGVDRLGLAGRPLCIHVSLRSFGGIDGGPATLVDGLLSQGCTVLAATMAGQRFGIPASPDDRPPRNGRDYAAQWTGSTEVYDATRIEADAWLGATSAYVARHPKRLRAASPPGAFSALGPLAADPDVMRCPDAACIECRDAAAGGPILD